MSEMHYSPQEENGQKPPVEHARPRNNRSRLTNGKQHFLGKGDGRSQAGRRFRDVCAILEETLGSKPTPVQGLMIRKCAGLSVLIETEETKLANGEKVDLAVYSNACGHLSRLIERLGMSPAAQAQATKPVVPTPEQIALRYAPQQTPTQTKHAAVRFDLMTASELAAYVERNGITNDQCRAEIERRAEQRDLDERTTDDVQPVKTKVGLDEFEHLL